MDQKQILVRCRKQGHAENRAILSSEIARIDFNTAPITDNHDTAEWREHREILRQIHVCEHLRHDINAASVCCCHDPVGVIGSFVIEHVLRTLFCDHGSAFISATCSNNSH